jgi:membrane protein YqaA with SNARE-associated domain
MRKQEHMKRWVKFSLFIVFIAFWIVLLSIVDPARIAQSIPVHNTYIVVFLLAVITGGSMFTAASGYAIIIALAETIPHIPLAFIAGLGTSIGDIAFFYLGKNANRVLSKKNKERIKKVGDFLEKKPLIVKQIAIFLYAAFVPIPNDFLTLFLGTIDEKVRRITIPIVLGNIVYYFILISFGRGIIGLF